MSLDHSQDPTHGGLRVGWARIRSKEWRREQSWRLGDLWPILEVRAMALIGLTVLFGFGSGGDLSYGFDIHRSCRRREQAYEAYKEKGSLNRPLA